MRPTRHKFTILKQVVELIPPNLVRKLAAKHLVTPLCRSFSAWSHVVSMVYAQLAHSLSLNDISDSLNHHSGALATIRGATPPSRNGLSHANKIRKADMAEALFWEVLSHLKMLNPKFGMGRSKNGLPRRFTRTINLVDSTTIGLIANCMDWARHRRRKAAAKCHMRLDLQSFLPRFAVVKAASTQDNIEAEDLCADIKAGEIVVFDKAYIDYSHLYKLDCRDVFWVTRAKENMAFDVVEKRSVRGTVKKDLLIRLKLKRASDVYPDLMRMVTALVEVDGKEVEMTFISNNLEWAPSSICDLYKSRWGIEVFFKQLKQTLQLADFLGYSENAVRWQIWTALLTYVILRFIDFQAKWQGSFTRLFTTVRGVLWSRFALYPLLEQCCGTASGPPRMCAVPDRLYFPGLMQNPVGQHL